MAIEYKYLIIDSKNNKKIYEKLPNDSTRSITAKKPGQYIILDKKGELKANISFVGIEKRSSKRKLSRMYFDTLNVKDFISEDNIKNLRFGANFCISFSQLKTTDVGQITRFASFLSFSFAFITARFTLI